MAPPSGLNNLNRNINAAVDISGNTTITGNAKKGKDKINKLNNLNLKNEIKTLRNQQKTARNFDRSTGLDETEADIARLQEIATQQIADAEAAERAKQAIEEANRYGKSQFETLLEIANENGLDATEFLKAFGFNSPEELKGDKNAEEALAAYTLARGDFENIKYDTNTNGQRVFANDRDATRTAEVLGASATMYAYINGCEIFNIVGEPYYIKPDGDVNMEDVIDLDKMVDRMTTQLFNDGGFTGEDVDNITKAHSAVDNSYIIATNGDAIRVHEQMANSAIKNFPPSDFGKYNDDEKDAFSFALCEYLMFSEDVNLQEAFKTNEWGSIDGVFEDGTLYNGAHGKGRYVGTNDKGGYVWQREDGTLFGLNEDGTFTYSYIDQFGNFQNNDIREDIYVSEAMAMLYAADMAAHGITIETAEEGYVKSGLVLKDANGEILKDDNGKESYRTRWGITDRLEVIDQVLRDRNPEYAALDEKDTLLNACDSYEDHEIEKVIGDLYDVEARKRSLWEGFWEDTLAVGATYAQGAIAITLGSLDFVERMVDGIGTIAIDCASGYIYRNGKFFGTIAGLISAMAGNGFEAGWTDVQELTDGVVNYLQMAKRTFVGESLVDDLQGLIYGSGGTGLELYSYYLENDSDEFANIRKTSESVTKTIAFEFLKSFGVPEEALKFVYNTGKTTEEIYADVQAVVDQYNADHPNAPVPVDWRTQVNFRAEAYAYLSAGLDLLKGKASDGIENAVGKWGDSINNQTFVDMIEGSTDYISPDAVRRLENTFNYGGKWLNEVVFTKFDEGLESVLVGYGYSPEIEEYAKENGIELRSTFSVSPEDFISGLAETGVKDFIKNAEGVVVELISGGYLSDSYDLDGFEFKELKGDAGAQGLLKLNEKKQKELSEEVMTEVAQEAWQKITKNEDYDIEETEWIEIGGDKNGQ